MDLHDPRLAAALANDDGTLESLEALLDGNGTPPVAPSTQDDAFDLDALDRELAEIYDLLPSSEIYCGLHDEEAIREQVTGLLAAHPRAWIYHYTSCLALPTNEKPRSLYVRVGHGRDGTNHHFPLHKAALTTGLDSLFTWLGEHDRYRGGRDYDGPAAL